MHTCLLGTLNPKKDAVIVWETTLHKLAKDIKALRVLWYLWISKDPRKTRYKEVFQVLEVLKVLVNLRPRELNVTWSWSRFTWRSLGTGWPCPRDWPIATWWHCQGWERPEFPRTMEQARIWRHITTVEFSNTQSEAKTKKAMQLKRTEKVWSPLRHSERSNKESSNESKDNKNRGPGNGATDPFVCPANRNCQWNHLSHSH